MDDLPTNATLEIVKILSNLASVVIVAYLAYLTTKLKSQGTEALQIAKDVKIQGDENLRITEATHTLVNGDKGVQLYVNKLVTERAAERSQDPMDIRQAAEANLLLEAHKAGQAIVAEKLQVGDEKHKEDCP